MKGLLSLVSDPDDFFTLLPDRPTNPWAGLLPVLIFTVLSASAAWLWLSRVIDLGVPEDGKFLLTITLAFTEVGALVSGLLTWFLGTAVIYFLVAGEHPRISLKKLLQATGLAHWPLVVYAIITLALAVLLRPETAGPFASPQELAIYITDSPFTHLTGQLRALAYGGTLVLCITAVRYMCRVRWGKATLVCLPPAVLVSAMYILVLWGGHK